MQTNNKYVHMTPERIDTMIEQLEEAKNLKHRKRVEQIGEAALQVFGGHLPDTKSELIVFFKQMLQLWVKYDMPTSSEPPCTSHPVLPPAPGTNPYHSPGTGTSAPLGSKG